MIPRLDDARIPVCVDLDGTLIYGDLLLESFMLLIKRNPLYVFACFWWLLRGKAHLKAHIAARVKLNGSALPYNHALTAWLQDRQSEGRPLWLCTASDQRLAQVVAAHVGIFDGVLGSDGRDNLAGTNKAAALTARFGERQFDYCGNSSADLPVWKAARQAIVVNASFRVEQAARAQSNVQAVLPGPSGGLKVIGKALRIHQWAKNALIFVPMMAAHQVMQPSTWGTSLLAFLAFSLCASSVYLLNDMLDLEADRQHKTKCKRPFAAGTLSLTFGLTMAPLLLIGAALICLTLPVQFGAVLAGYYALTAAYSLDLKRRIMVDVLTLAGLYTVRIVAGAAAASIPLSFWLLLFAIFIFLSLALVKRYAELDGARKQGKMKAKGRGYVVEDIALLQSLGAASGYLSVLVLALYLNSPEVAKLYKDPKVLWLLMPLFLYWISRIWMQTHRGNMHDDPLVFAFKDRISILTGALVAAIMFIATT